MKIKTIKIPIYDIYFTIHDNVADIGFDKQKAAAGLSWNYETDPQAHARLAFNMDFITMGRIAHECTHLAIRIFDRACINVDAANDEPLAYLVQYLVDNVSSALLKHSKTI